MQAQAGFLDIYRSINNAATETLSAGLHGIERANEDLLHWVRASLQENDRLTNRLAQARNIDELFLAQSQFAFSQVTSGIEVWWRLFRAIQDSQLATVSRMETGVGQATRTARRSFDLAMQDAWPERHGSAWGGAERRKASVLPFPGPERRKADATGSGKGPSARKVRKKR